MSEQSKTTGRATLLRRALAALGVISTVTAAVSTATASAAAPGYLTVTTVAKAADCPSGHVCVYPDDSSSGTPDTYFKYGSYNFEDVFGTRLIVNNQTGGAGFRLCTSYGGQNCGARKGPGTYHENLSPINSILLEP